ncbi:MAG: enoyl-CoA hydratase-related protein [Pirellulaceae bacterium]
MTYSTLIYEVDQWVATITLNRPERMNAITPELEAELLDAMKTAEASDLVRVIVLTGAGRAFCAGADLSNLAAVSTIDWSTANRQELEDQILPPRPRENTCDDYQRTYSYFPAVGKPIIGAINGPSIGLGMIISLYCDIRIASDEARFGTAFAQRGLIAEYGISWLLPRLIGLSNALDLLYSARVIDAQEALRMGLVSRVVPAAELASESGKYARLLATSVSPRSLRVIKKQVYEGMLGGLGEAIDAANEEMWLSLQCGLSRRRCTLLRNAHQTLQAGNESL